MDKGGKKTTGKPATGAKPTAAKGGKPASADAGKAGVRIGGATVPPGGKSK